MEESTSTAIFTGAFVLVFVSSLTISLFLFNSILDFSEQAYEYNVSISDNQVIINAPVGKERLLTTEQVASYYYNYIAYDLYEGEKPNKSYDIRIYNSTITNDSYKIKDTDYNYKDLMDYLGKKTYILTYEKIEDKKPVIIIKQATDEQINSML